MRTAPTGRPSHAALPRPCCCSPVTLIQDGAGCAARLKCSRGHHWRGGGVPAFPWPRPPVRCDDACACWSWRHALHSLPGFPHSLSWVLSPHDSSPLYIASEIEILETGSVSARDARQLFMSPCRRASVAAPELPGRIVDDHFVVALPGGRGASGPWMERVFCLPRSSACWLPHTPPLPHSVH